MSLYRAGRKITLAAAGALLVAAPGALAATSEIGGSINPNKGKPGTPLDLNLNFRIDVEDRDTPATITNIVLQFPRNATHNGKLFRSCSADFIQSQRGYKDCPKGSKIGTGKGTSDVPNAGVYNVPVDFTFFNGPGGKSIVIHVKAIRPAPVNVAFNAPLKRTSGRFGYRLTAPVPTTLQDINQGSDWYVGLRTFRSKVGGTVMVRGKKRGFIEAKRCPSGGRVPIQGNFTFLRDHEPTQSNSFITCRP